MNKGTVLIIDDEDKLRGLLSRIIGIEGYHVIQAPTAQKGLKLAEAEQVHVVLCDVKLPDTSGLQLIERIKECSPASEIIMLTAFGNIADGVSAIKQGAFDYITKGDDNEKILPLLSKAMEKARLQFRMKELEKRLQAQFGFENILGTSPSIRQAIALARQVAPTDATVLLLGETGTGKEVFAQAIHCESSRRHKPFVAVNCSAFAKDLLESELFGHKAGAFTGALKDKKGLFEEAHGGTIFLDEIGEMNPDLQAKLLRVLESGAFYKVGDSKSTQVDARIIAATNRNLEEEIEKGNFRSDLFYRLSVFQLRLPSLDERKGDIKLLADHFTRHFSLKTNKRIAGASPEFLRLLEAHSWKGNIRELKNIIERAVILCNGNQLEAAHLPFEFSSPSGDMPLTVFDLREAEKRHIKLVLNRTQGNKTEAARLLNIGLTTLYRKIQEYKLEEQGH